MSDRFKHARSRDELLEIFDRQLRHMRRSCELYDAGVEEEAERLSTSVYTLAFDGSGRTVSVLTQLGFSVGLRIIDSRTQLEGIDFENPPPRSFFAPPLCMIRMSAEKVSCVPHCHASAEVPPEWPRVSFSKWWESTVFRATNGRTLTRKNVVFHLRSQDGGSHVDRVIKEEAYHWLRVDLDPSVRAGVGNKQGPITNAHWATMRQIAWELDHSLRQSGY